MKKNSFKFVSLLLVLLLSQTACSENKQQNQSPQKIEMHSANSELLVENNKTSSTKVYEITKVEKATDGKITDFSFTDENGKESTLSSIIKNKYVFLNFWATWCPPCRAEIPAIIELQNEFKSKDLVVIGIALERERSLAGAQKKVYDYASNNKINYLNFVAKDEIIKALVDSYNGIPYIPTTFLIDKKGFIFEKIQGGRDKEAFLKSIENLIK